LKKLSFSLLFAFLIVGFFAVSAAANSPLEPVKVEPTNRNANQTGVGVDKENNFSQAIKNVEGHKTHGDYQHNTNSCASCHQTHTAKTGSRLLFADTQYQTCVSCHDGTLGFYNVLETGEKASLDGAGTFGGSHANNMSIHMANNSMQIKAAPGGNPNGTNETGGVQWGAQFSCASCHAPHGSYSDRLLHYNLKLRQEIIRLETIFRTCQSQILKLPEITYAEPQLMAL
jgi:predicted CXXCH cytochrome family protein